MNQYRDQRGQSSGERTDDDSRAIEILRLFLTLVGLEGVDGDVRLSASLQVTQALWEARQIMLMNNAYHPR